MSDLLSDMSGDEGGGWNCSAPAPGGRGQGTPMGESLFNIFFLAGNRAGGLSWSAVVNRDKLKAAGLPPMFEMTSLKPT